MRIALCALAVALAAPLARAEAPRPRAPARALRAAALELRRLPARVAEFVHAAPCAEPAALDAFQFARSYAAQFIVAPILGDQRRGIMLGAHF